MLTIDHFFFALGLAMVACLAFFIASDPRISWKRIVRIIIMALAIMMLILFFTCMFFDISNSGKVL